MVTNDWLIEFLFQGGVYSYWLIDDNFISHSRVQNKKACQTFKNSEYDQEIPQSQTADNPMAPRGRATQPS